MVSTYIRTYPITALAAVTAPKAGGETLVLDQRRPVATAASHLLQALQGVEFFHVASRVSCPSETGDGAWHPALRAADGGSSVAFYLGARERLAEGRRWGLPLEKDETRSLIDSMFAPDFSLTY